MLCVISEPGDELKPFHIGNCPGSWGSRQASTSELERTSPGRPSSMVALARFPTVASLFLTSACAFPLFAWTFPISARANHARVFARRRSRNFPVVIFDLSLSVRNDKEKFRNVMNCFLETTHMTATAAPRRTSAIGSKKNRSAKTAPHTSITFPDTPKRSAGQQDALRISSFL